MALSATSKTTYPKLDEGFIHLTATGWQRKDTSPFPADRVATWSFPTAPPTAAAKQQVPLERLWTSHHLAPKERDQIRARFGYPFRASHDVHLTIDCRD